MTQWALRRAVIGMETSRANGGEVDTGREGVGVGGGLGRPLSAL